MHWAHVLVLGAIAGMLSLLLFSVQFPVIDLAAWLESLRWTQDLMKYVLAAFTFGVMLSVFGRG